MMKEILSKTPILCAPDLNHPFVVGTDASQLGVGAILYQKIGEEIRYIAFASKQLNKGQRNYPAPKRELLAVIFALKKWRELLMWRKFVVETDHMALLYIRKSNSYMVRDWLSFFSRVQFQGGAQEGFLERVAT